MSRALTKYYGVKPDLDIEAQRAIVVLTKPVAFDWHRVDALIKKASYTFAGAHLRVRGRVRSAPTATDSLALVFEVESSAQRFALTATPLGRSVADRPVEAVLRVDEWKQGAPKVSLISVK